MAGITRVPVDAAATALVPTAPLRTYTPAKVKIATGKELAVPLQMTVKEFESFPWPEGQRWELIRGVPVMSAAPLPSHQDLLFDLAVLLRERLSSNNKLRVFLGVDVLLPGAANYTCPDISVIESDKEIDLNERPYKLVPRLLVEGLSPSTMGNDSGAKLQAFAEAGVPEYWIANPSNGALSILVNPHELTYDEVVAEADGFVRSPLLDLAIRVRRDRSRFIVETRA